MRWLTPPDWPPVWESLTLMFQREVAERIVAKPGTRPMGGSRSSPSGAPRRASS